MQTGNANATIKAKFEKAETFDGKLPRFDAYGQAV
jgi:hypothetical protein